MKRSSTETTTNREKAEAAMKLEEERRTREKRTLSPRDRKEGNDSNPSSPRHVDGDKSLRRQMRKSATVRGHSEEDNEASRKKELKVESPKEAEKSPRRQLQKAATVSTRKDDDKDSKAKESKKDQTDSKDQKSEKEPKEPKEPKEHKEHKRHHIKSNSEDKEAGSRRPLQRASTFQPVPSDGIVSLI